MQLDAAVQDGLQFLQSRQMPSGQFPVEMTTISNGVTRVEPDDALFSTAHIIYSIGQIPDPVAIGITNLGLDYFQNEMTGHGLWRHWNKDSVRAGRRLAPFIPADLDDMCCISYLLRRHGRQYPDNKRLVALNRNRAGLFYTWMMLRPTPTLNLTYWLSMISEFNLQRFTIFWKVTEAGYLDVDGVVNANVMLYLGETRTTRSAAAWLKEIVETGREAECDKWYRDVYTFHYAVSRIVADGSHALDDIRELAVNRLTSVASENGRLGDNILHSALAIISLLNWGVSGAIIDRAIANLIESQEQNGSWPSEIYYYGGPKKVAHWGSSELTTGICMEALYRYRLSIRGGA